MCHLIECCLGNVDAPVRTRLAESDHPVRAKPCLQRCGDCYRGSFLVIDGEMVRGDHRATLDRLDVGADRPEAGGATDEGSDPA
ncbi:MAG: DUF1450 domain-containing protein [Salinigranum sp.]